MINGFLLQDKYKGKLRTLKSMVLVIHDCLHCSGETSISQLFAALHLSCVCEYSGYGTINNLDTSIESPRDITGGIAAKEACLQ
jgi:hypothetical protein